LKKNFKKAFLLKKILLITGVIVFVFVSVSYFLPQPTEEKEKPSYDKDLKTKFDFPALGKIDEDIKEPDQIIVYDHTEGEKKEKNMEKYLIGVVAAEMPPSFHQEALKAQAVAARSYTMARLPEFGGTGCSHKEGADICTNPNHCQDYMDEDDAEKKWGKRGNKKWDKVRQSVKSTRGEVLKYSGKLVTDAPYHSTCGGKTESAQKVWGTELGYIKPVECEYCQHSQKYTDKVELKDQQVADVVSSVNSNAKNHVLSGEKPVQVLNRSSTGRVLEAKIGGQVISGREVRQMFDLKSTNFSLEHNDGSGWVFKTRGFGHGVGLCQYGADGMAKDGYEYREILDHYFQNILAERIYK